MDRDKNTKGVTKQGAGSPSLHSIDEILKHIDPAPDEMTECFVAAIYAARQESAERFSVAPGSGLPSHVSAAPHIVKGKYAHVPTSSDDFIERKRADLGLEDRR